MRGLIVPALLLALASTAHAGGWDVALLAGTAASLPSRLEIEQDGSPAIALRARYESRAFEPPLYYVVRAGRRLERGAWELQLVHHKLHLRNPPPEVAHFEASHGYNLVTLGRSWRRGPLTWRVMGGAVVPHTESTVRGRSLHSGYRLGGPTLGGGAGVTPTLGPRLRALAEISVFAAHARMPIAGGRALGAHASLHAAIGLEFAAPRR